MDWDWIGTLVVLAVTFLGLADFLERWQAFKSTGKATWVDRVVMVGIVSAVLVLMALGLGGKR